jgi:hypothetical protein
MTKILSMAAEDTLGAWFVDFLPFSPLVNVCQYYEHIPDKPGYEVQ